MEGFHNFEFILEKMQFEGDKLWGLSDSFISCNEFTQRVDKGCHFFCLDSADNAGKEFEAIEDLIREEFVE